MKKKKSSNRSLVSSKKYKNVTQGLLSLTTKTRNSKTDINETLEELFETIFQKKKKYVSVLFRNVKKGLFCYVIIIIL